MQCPRCGETDREHLIITPTGENVLCDTCGKIFRGDDCEKSIELAKKLIRQAEGLLPAGTGEQEFKLSEIRESL